MKRTKHKKRSHSRVLITGTVLAILGLLVVLAALIVAKFDLQRFYTIHYESHGYEIAEEFQSLSISTEGASLTVLASDDGVCRVICNEANSVFYSIAVQDGTLHISLDDTREWYERRLSFTLASPDITVYLPVGSYLDLSLSNTSGSIRVEPAYTFASILLSSTSGDITCTASAQGGITARTESGDVKLSAARAATLNATTSTGKISLWELEAHAISAASRTGDIRLADIASTEISATTEPGKITVIDTTAVGSLYIRSTSGKVSLRRADAAAITVETSSGDISGSLLSPKLFDVSSEHGRVSHPDSAGSAPCTVRTKRGSVRLDVAN